MHVLFVCTGNVCRSPIAEALARRLLAEAGLGDVTVASAGTAAADGAPASEGAYLVGLEQGLDLSHHSARLLTRELVTGADHVLGMSQHHVDRAAALGAGPKARLLGAFAGRDTTEAEVPDPYGGGLEEYRATYAQLEGLLREAVRRIASERGSGGGHG